LAFEDLIRESGVHLVGAPIQSTQQKALSDFIPEYLVPEMSTHIIYHGQGRSRSPSIYSLAKHLGVVNEDWYLGYHSYRLRRPKEGSALTRPNIQKILEDRGILPKGLDNNICKKICKIGK
jgi:hypothetical protein